MLWRLCVTAGAGVLHRFSIPESQDDYFYFSACALGPPRNARTWWVRTHLVPGVSLHKCQVRHSHRPGGPRADETPFLQKFAGGLVDAYLAKHSTRACSERTAWNAISRVRAPKGLRGSRYIDGLEHESLEGTDRIWPGDAAGSL